MHERNIEAAKDNYHAKRMADSSNACVAPIQQAPIDRALEELAANVARAHNEFDELIMRLRPITEDVPSGPSSNASMPVSCEMEGRISHASTSACDLTERIRSLRASLCI